MPPQYTNTDQKPRTRPRPKVAAKTRPRPQTRPRPRPYAPAAQAEAAGKMDLARELRSKPGQSKPPGKPRTRPRPRPQTQQAAPQPTLGGRPPGMTDPPVGQQKPTLQPQAPPNAGGSEPFYPPGMMGPPTRPPEFGGRPPVESAPPTAGYPGQPGPPTAGPPPTLAAPPGPPPSVEPPPPTYRGDPNSAAARYGANRRSLSTGATHLQGQMHTGTGIQDVNPALDPNRPGGPTGPPIQQMPAPQPQLPQQMMPYDPNKPWQQGQPNAPWPQQGGGPVLTQPNAPWPGQPVAQPQVTYYGGPGGARL